MTKIPNLFCVLVIEYWNLKFVCNLVLEVWDFISSLYSTTFPPEGETIEFSSATSPVPTKRKSPEASKQRAAERTPGR